MTIKRATVNAIRDVLRVRVLPARIARFQWRARREARSLGDSFTLGSSTRPGDLKRLLELASGRRHVVELGTANGWTAIALALADAERHVVTFDPFDRPERAVYLTLVPASVRARITFVAEPGRNGPAAAGDDRCSASVELLYIDSSHDRDETIAEVRVWMSALAPGAVIVFDDYNHPDYPGVREAIEALGLRGRVDGTLYVVNAGAASPRT